MPVSVSWDDQEADILRLQFKGRWTWDELFDTGSKLVSMAVSSPGPVGVISDMFSTPYRPPYFEEGSNQLLSNNTQPSNLRIVVLVGDALAYTMFRAYAQKSGLNFPYAFAPDAEQAREVIGACRRGEPVPDYAPVSLMERN